MRSASTRLRAAAALVALLASLEGSGTVSGQSTAGAELRHHLFGGAGADAIPGAGDSPASANSQTAMTASTRELFAFTALSQAAYATVTDNSSGGGQQFTRHTTSPTTAFYDFDAPPVSEEGSNSSEKHGQEASGQDGTTLAVEPKPCACTKIYRPVCSGGKTYSNDCVAACAGVDIDCDGKCPCPGTTLAGQITKALQPVVGWEVSAAEIKPFGPNAVIAGELQIPVGNQSDNSLSNVAVPFLAFRGSSNLLNWISNFRSQNLTACGFGSVQGESPAAVAPKYCCARGFWETYKRWLQQFVLQWAAERAATSQAGAPVLITGHSLGGAFAVFAAADVLEAQPSLNVTVASYNAPRAGTQSLAQLVDTGAWRALRLQTFPELFSTLPFRANIFANEIPQCAGQIPTHTGVKFAININLSNTADPPTFPNWTVTPTEVCSTGSSADTQRPGFFDVTEYWRRAYNSSLAATADAAHGFFVTGNAVAAPQPVEAANPYLGLPLAVHVNASCAEALPQA